MEMLNDLEAFNRNNSSIAFIHLDSLQAHPHAFLAWLFRGNTWKDKSGKYHKTTLETLERRKMLQYFYPNQIGQKPKMPTGGSNEFEKKRLREAYDLARQEYKGNIATVDSILNVYSSGWQDKRVFVNRYDVSVKLNPYDFDRKHFSANIYYKPSKPSDGYITHTMKPGVSYHFDPKSKGRVIHEFPIDEESAEKFVVKLEEQGKSKTFKYEQNCSNEQGLSVCLRLLNKKPNSTLPLMKFYLEKTDRSSGASMREKPRESRDSFELPFKEKADEEFLNFVKSGR